MEISLIAAASLNNVIGKDGDIPWNMPRDMRLFKEITTGHHILSGRVNYMTIPDKYRPLSNRTNLVVTHNRDFADEGAVVFHDIQEAVDFAKKAGETELMIIGGGEIYKQCMAIADNIYLSRIQTEIEGDTFFPELPEDAWRLLDAEYFDKDDKNPYDFSFEHYVRK